MEQILFQILTVSATRVGEMTAKTPTLAYLSMKLTARQCGITV